MISAQMRIYMGIRKIDGDGDADESNRRNEDVNQEQNAIENNRNDINNANQGQPMEEDSKIEDDK